MAYAQPMKPKPRRRYQRAIPVRATVQEIIRLKRAMAEFREAVRRDYMRSEYCATCGADTTDEFPTGPCRNCMRATAP